MSLCYRYLEFFTKEIEMPPPPLNAVCKSMFIKINTNLKQNLKENNILLSFHIKWDFVEDFFLYLNLAS